MDLRHPLRNYRVQMISFDDILTIPGILNELDGFRGRTKSKRQLDFNVKIELTKVYWKLAGKMEINLKNWQNLLKYYVSALIREREKSITFYPSQQGKSIFSVLRGELLFSSVNDHIVIKSNSSLKDFFEYIQKNSLLGTGSFNYGFSLARSSVTLESRLNYTPGTIFDTFPFLNVDSREITELLASIATKYYDFCRNLMLTLQHGLTKTYNLFHNKDLKPDDRQLFKSNLQITPEQAIKDIEHLRELHKQMDEAVQKAYGWEDINLAHDFYEVDYLHENDRIRYTISPEARKEVLKRLLELNHKIHAEEVAAGLWDKKKSGGTKKKEKVTKLLPAGHTQEELF